MARSQDRKAFSFPTKREDFVKSGWCGNRPKCVSVAVKPEGVAVRDTKTGNTQFYTNGEWDAFVKGVKDGEFDTKR